MYTPDKKIFRDMQEHPEKYSDQELEAMMDDLDQMSDVDMAWQQFCENEELRVKSEALDLWSLATEGTQEFATAQPTAQHNSQFSIFNSQFRKVAAMFVGILMLSGIAFAAIHLWSLTPAPSPKGEGSEYNVMSDTTRQSSPLPSEGSGEATPVRYDEATLEQILTDMADYYRLTLNWKSEEAKTLRLFYIWNKQQSAVEAVKSMNSFEHIRLELSDSILTADMQISSPK